MCSDETIFSTEFTNRENGLVAPSYFLLPVKKSSFSVFRSSSVILYVNHRSPCLRKFAIPVNSATVSERIVTKILE